MQDDSMTSKAYGFGKELDNSGLEGSHITYGSGY